MRDFQRNRGPLPTSRQHQHPRLRSRHHLVHTGIGVTTLPSANVYFTQTTLCSGGNGNSSAQRPDGKPQKKTSTVCVASERPRYAPHRSPPPGYTMQSGYPLPTLKLRKCAFTSSSDRMLSAFPPSQPATPQPSSRTPGTNYRDQGLVSREFSTPSAPYSPAH